MIEVLCNHLYEKHGLYLEDMVVFPWDELQAMITTSSIRRALMAKSWSKKTARRRAEEQNAELRDYYLHNLSDFKSYHLVYIDDVRRLWITKYPIVIYKVAVCRSSASHVKWGGFFSSTNYAHITS
jgi:hypothetical protein